MKTILLVEDGCEDETPSLRALKQLPVRYRVVVAHTGKDALRHVASGEARSDDTTSLPSLVLMDP